MVRLTDRPDMTLDVYRGCKTTNQQQMFMTCKIKIVDIQNWVLRTAVNLIFDASENEYLISIK